MQAVCRSVFPGLLQTSVPSSLDCAPVEQELPIYHHHALYNLYRVISFPLLHFGYFSSTQWRKRMRTWISWKRSLQPAFTASHISNKGARNWFFTFISAKIRVGGTAHCALTQGICPDVSVAGSYGFTKWETGPWIQLSAIKSLSAV